MPLSDNSPDVVRVFCPSPGPARGGGTWCGRDVSCCGAAGEGWMHGDAGGCAVMKETCGDDGDGGSVRNHVGGVMQ
ncbi:hypothetical protein E2C01_091268 [Portunus trituberculatus]|uniref:Uncharacterized protein n=1 Tax=Portunus trituberculatus TaxID=210409 RepID=A0A5B7JIP4_PORTR|nr:hypothetical protein [Portunus trituberculatus]